MKYSIQDVPPIAYSSIEVDPKYNSYIKKRYK